MFALHDNLIWSSNDRLTAWSFNIATCSTTILYTLWLFKINIRKYMSDSLIASTSWRHCYHPSWVNPKNKRGKALDEDAGDFHFSMQIVWNDQKSWLNGGKSRAGTKNLKTWTNGLKLPAITKIKNVKTKLKKLGYACIFFGLVSFSLFLIHKTCIQNYKISFWYSFQHSFFFFSHFTPWRGDLVKWIKRMGSVPFLCFVKKENSTNQVFSSLHKVIWRRILKPLLVTRLVRSRVHFNYRMEGYHVFLSFKFQVYTT